MKTLLYTFLLVSLFSCKKQIVFPEYGDPMTKLFWGKRVKLMRAIYLDEPSFVDTTYFDEAGNATIEKRYGFYRKTLYDNKHFPIDEFIDGEFVSHFIFKYSVRENQLIQSWFVSDTDSLANKVIFDLDDYGRIIKATDTKWGSYWLFEFDGNLLISKTKYESQNGRVFEKWIFEYKNDNLIMSELISGDKSIMKYYVNTSGVLDSAVRKGSDKIKYEFEYR